MALVNFCINFFIFIRHVLGQLTFECAVAISKVSFTTFFPVLFTTHLNSKTISKGVAFFLITTFFSACIAILINNNLISPLSEYFSVMQYSPHTSAFIKYNYHNILLAFFICNMLVFNY